MCSRGPPLADSRHRRAGVPMIVCAKFPALASPRQSLSAEGNDIYNISTTESPLSVTYQPRARQRTLRAAYFLSSDAERKHHPGQGVAVVALFVHGQGATEFRAAQLRDQAW